MTQAAVECPARRVLPAAAMAEQLAAERAAGKRIVFTNGCFDLLHTGHLRYLAEARSRGDLLVVALNTDASVQVIKGPSRPINPQEERAEILAALEMVDYVTFFGEPTPQEIIALLQPDVLVKGGDWPVEAIVGREVVWARGGSVESIPFVEGQSSTSIIQRIQDAGDERVTGDKTGR